MNHLITIVFCVLILFSCKKEEETSYTYNSAEDNALAQTLTLDIFKAMHEVATNFGGGPWGDCVGVFELDNGSEPSTFFVSYMGGDCESLSGRKREGEVYGSQTGMWNTAGSTMEIQLNGFSLDEYSIDGTAIITCQGENATGQQQYIYEVVDASIKNPENVLRANWSCMLNLVWISGEASDFNVDDTFRITGEMEGSNRNNTSFTGTVTDPITMDFVCPWLLDGKVEVVPSDKEPRSLEYGLGECNAAATVRINEQTYTINLP